MLSSSTSAEIFFLLFPSETLTPNKTFLSFLLVSVAEVIIYFTSSSPPTQVLKQLSDTITPALPVLTITTKPPFAFAGMATANALSNQIFKY